MTIEKSLERIASALEKLVDLNDKPVSAYQALGEKPEKKEKPKKKAKPKKEDIPLDKIKKAVKDVKKKEEVKKLTFEDVKKEARILVDGTGDRKGFEKAQLILKKLGAPSLKELVPAMYAEAVNDFIKAVKNFEKK